MTLPATGMTIHAMGLHGRGYCGHCLLAGGIHSSQNCSVIRSQSNVETGPIFGTYFFMAVPAGLGWVGIRRIFNNPLVGCLPIWILGIPAVTGSTTELAVFGIQKIRVHKNFLMQLQRSQFSSSALSTSSGRLLACRSSLLNDSRNLDKLTCLGVTRYTLIGFRTVLAQG